MAKPVVLILGGTADANRLAAALTETGGFAVITSLAGRTKDPKHPPGTVRQGGFGGAAGLGAYIQDRNVAAVIDATHPFATQISTHATDACRATDTPRLQLHRPPWMAMADDNWIDAKDIAHAARLLPGRSQRAFLTVGRQELAAFTSCTDVWFLIRMIDLPADMPKFADAEILRARGPFSFDDEVALMHAHRIDHLITKNSGGTATYAKVAAARHLNIPVVMIAPPDPEPGPAVETVDVARTWLLSVTE